MTKLKAYVMLTKIGVLLVSTAFLFLFSSCLPWGWGGPGFGSGPGGMGGSGGMMGQGGMGGGMMGGGQSGSGGMMGGQGGMGGMMGQGGMGQGGMGGSGGMMGGGQGMMGGQGGPAAPYSAPGQAITIDQAIELAQRYATSLGNPDIVLDEVEEYRNNFYALFTEKSTQMYAFEMLMDKTTGRLYPEPGPNMMWNTKYGMMASMMGSATSSTPSPYLTPQQAEAQARAFLDTNLPGIAPGGLHPLYGYYTIMVKKDGRNYGMLSVNSYSGQVWYHTWHGDFIQEREIKA